MKRILNITHQDFDGLGCEVAVKFNFMRDDVEVVRCNYHNIDEIIKNKIDSNEIYTYDEVFITDISIGEEIAEIINNDCLLNKIVTLIDHHPTALWLNKYEWAIVFIEKDGRKISASKLVCKHFGITNPVVCEFIELADSYDCWHWKSEGNQLAKDVNDLLYIVGFNEIVGDVLSQSLIKSGFTVDNKYKFLLEMRAKEYERYLDSCDKSLKVVKHKGYTFGFVIAERFTSELGNDLALLHEELDFIAILNMRSGVSLRGIKNNLDLGIVAKDLGECLGMKHGGHKQASGITLTDEFKLENIFKMLKFKEDR